MNPVNKFNKKSNTPLHFKMVIGELLEYEDDNQQLVRAIALTNVSNDPFIRVYNITSNSIEDQMVDDLSLVNYRKTLPNDNIYQLFL
jgi:hypothetical protein